MALLSPLLTYMSLLFFFSRKALAFWQILLKEAVTQRFGADAEQPYVTGGGLGTSKWRRSWFKVT